MDHSIAKIDQTHLHLNVEIEYEYPIRYAVLIFGLSVQIWQILERSQ
jgi:hypothetical protein